MSPPDDHSPTSASNNHPSEVPNELVLFLAWCGGDEGAGNAFLRIVRDRLLGYLRCCPPDVAEDVAHDVIATLLEARAGLQEPRAVLGYLFTVARRLRARELARRDVPVDELDELRPPAWLTDHIEVDRIDAMMLLANQEGSCIRTLAEYYLVGLRAPEIAKREGVSVGTVRSRIRHGLEQLQALARY